MGEKANDRITIGRPASDVMAVIADLESYPEWAEGVTKFDVHSRDDDGRPVEATMYVDAKVMEIDYKLRYTFDSDTHVSWTLTESGQVSQLDGSYDLVEKDGSTEVTYALEIDLLVPLPGFMKKRAAKVILATGLKGLRDRVEQS